MTPLKIDYRLAVSDLLEMAGTNAQELEIAEHSKNYLKILVRVASGAIVDVVKGWTANDYYLDADWHQIISVGCGSQSCNCDACTAGDDPADWCDGNETIDGYQQQVDKFVDWYANFEG